MSRSLFNLALGGAIVLTGLLATPSHAQFARPTGVAAQGGVQGQGGGILSLPPSVKRVVSVDAHNILLVEVENENGEIEYVTIPIRHVYSGGVAAAFGGTSIPTSLFVSPGYANGSGSGQGNGNGFNTSSTNNLFNGGNNGFNTGGNVGNFNSGASTNGRNDGSLFPGVNFNGQMNPNTTTTGTGIFAPLSTRPGQVPGRPLRN